MQLNLREQLMQFVHILQGSLFSAVEEEIGELTPPARLLTSVLAMVQIRPCLIPRGRMGRPVEDRVALTAAFIAKAVYQIATTRQLLHRLRTDTQLRRICGWARAHQVPHESTFSRAFAEFAHSELPQRLHVALIEATQRDRLVGHISRDSTAIEAREHFPGMPRSSRPRPASRPSRQRQRRKRPINARFRRLPSGAHRSSGNAI